MQVSVTAAFADAQAKTTLQQSRNRRSAAAARNRRRQRRARSGLGSVTIAPPAVAPFADRTVRRGAARPGASTTPTRVPRLAQQTERRTQMRGDSGEQSGMSCARVGATVPTPGTRSMPRRASSTWAGKAGTNANLWGWVGRLPSTQYNLYQGRQGETECFCTLFNWATVQGLRSSNVSRGCMGREPAGRVTRGGGSHCSTTERGKEGGCVGRTRTGSTRGHRGSCFVDTNLEVPRIAEVVRAPARDAEPRHRSLGFG